MTYNMNMLQGLTCEEDFLVSLNAKHLCDPSKVLREVTYEHPIFDLPATKAQSQWNLISDSDRRTHFAGAYWFNGFHEDGVQSALRACQQIHPEARL